jgi:uncharacterized protein (UPF0332 family)
MGMFDWQDYYLLARQMLLQADNASYKEAVFRTAVSRAYYAAYHFACDYLKEVGHYPTKQEIQASRTESHQFLIERFIKNSAHPEWEKIGKKLITLKSFRHRADYERLGTYMFTDINEMKEKIDTAEEIISLIKLLKI